MKLEDLRNLQEAYTSIYEKKYEMGEKEEEMEDEKEGEEECVPASKKNKHNCAKKVCHEEFGEGTCIFGQHAEPDRYGYVSHYDVLFEHGVERGIPTTEMQVLVSEMHGGHKKKKK